MTNTFNSKKITIKKNQGLDPILSSRKPILTLLVLVTT